MTTALSRASFQTTIQSGRVMNQSEGESLFFMIHMPVNDCMLLGIFDTGSSDFITLKSCLQEPAQFLNISLGEKRVQVVGGAHSLQQAHIILWPIKNPDFDYQVTHCLSVDTIISPIPEVDHSKIIDEAYCAYVTQCHTTNTIVAYTRLDWPLGAYGGPISFLAGIKNIIFSVIFQLQGLIFIEHNIACGPGQSNIAVGGS